MKNIIFNIINKYGYFGITFLIALENIIPPIPSEVILSFSGFISKYANLNLLLIIISSTLGSLIGALILYYLAYFIGLKLLDFKFFKICGLKSENVKKSINHFKTNGKKSIFFGRFVPIIRSFISIPAGLSNMDIKLFVILTTIGSLIWNTIFIFIGYFLKDKWEIITTFFENYSFIIFLVFIGIYFIIKRIKARKIITVG